MGANEFTFPKLKKKMIQTEQTEALTGAQKYNNEIFCGLQ